MVLRPCRRRAGVPWPLPRHRGIPRAGPHPQLPHLWTLQSWQAGYFFQEKVNECRQFSVTLISSGAGLGKRQTAAPVRSPPW